LRACFCGDRRKAQEAKYGPGGGRRARKGKRETEKRAKAPGGGGGRGPTAERLPKKRSRFGRRAEHETVCEGKRDGEHSSSSRSRHPYGRGCRCAGDLESGGLGIARRKSGPCCVIPHCGERPANSKSPVPSLGRGGVEDTPSSAFRSWCICTGACRVPTATAIRSEMVRWHPDKIGRGFGKGGGGFVFFFWGETAIHEAGDRKPRGNVASYPHFNL